MRPGTGRRRAGEDNVRLRMENMRLRREVATVRGDLTWYRNRLMAITARCRALTAQAEIADGERLLDQQLIHRQTVQLMALDEENEELRRQLKAACDDTAEMPIVRMAEPEPKLAGVS
ncbi:hypothetical protein AB0I27_23020 [Streptomyces sp. NPDC050597]|uniref:hypothetical protein n=1 Tax=Streptomyces sp. NPDC050597 TaxID=3157212 RepID=UPI0034497B12